MKRRSFIKDTVAGLPILLLPPTLLSGACKKGNETKSNGKRVLVIGAGISGLVAGKKLKENGFEVVILESQDRVGGRLRTNRSLGLDFDEGASWIHGVSGNPISSLAELAGMTTYETIDDQADTCYDVGGVLRNPSSYTAAETELYSILETLKNNGNLTQSFETVFAANYPDKANDRLWKFLLSSYVTFDCGDLDKLSSVLYNEGEEFGGVEKIATNGYDTIANYLAGDLKILLNQAVSKVDYSNSKIMVSHQGTISEADYVLVTVPLGVLKSNSIQFVPELPGSKLNAIQKIGMNCVNKFLLTWDTAFWDNTQYICYTPETKDKFNYFVNLNKFHPTSNALMTFAYAEYARQTESMTDAQITDEIMLHLRDIYGNGIPNPTNLLRTKWNTNQHSFGSYSYTAIGTEMQHFEDLAEEVNDQLFFAGEHTEVDYFSTVHGAYLSGLREANKIIDLI